MTRHLISSNSPPKKTGYVNFKDHFFFSFFFKNIFWLLHVTFSINKQTEHIHILHKSVNNVCSFLKMCSFLFACKTAMS